MEQKKDNPELAVFTLLNPDFSVGDKQIEGEKDKKQSDPPSEMKYQTFPEFLKYGQN